ncbi:GntP family permease [Treponema phagedenis]|uniref:GntP family permease n=1 Tax=Treponema phagedenis TaxID=162 RepID=UPI0004B256C1|nr:GntP family permease [Treponema phagedenis]
MFKASGIPKRFLPGTIALGAFTFTMTALPGSPQIQNTIPMKFFGTDAFAAPILGLIASLIMAVGGILWLNYRAKSAMAKGEGYGDHDMDNKSEQVNQESDLPNTMVAFLPIIVVLGLNFILSKMVYPHMDLSYLEADRYSTTAKAVIGNWSLIASLVSGILVTIVFNLKRIDSVLKTLTTGVSGSFLAIFNTASETGYGNVIASLASFVIIKDALMSVSSNILVNEAISVSALAGVTGSASGGLSIALGVLGETYMKMASQVGIDPQVLHRVASIACGGLDTLPHNGAVITLLGITGMTHKESYIDIGMCTVVIPTISVITIILLSSLGIV